MQSADALYLSLQKSKVLEHTIPSKLFDYLAMSRPIVAALTGEGNEVLKETGANLCLDPGDEEGLQTALVELVQNYDTLSANAHKNRELVLARFTRERAVQTLMSVFEKVVG